MRAVMLASHEVFIICTEWTRVFSCSMSLGGAPPGFSFEVLKAPFLAIMNRILDHVPAVSVTDGYIAPVSKSERRALGCWASWASIEGSYSMGIWINFLQRRD